MNDQKMQNDQKDKKSFTFRFDLLWKTPQTPPESCLKTADAKPDRIYPDVVERNPVHVFSEAMML